jgi:dTDP-4-amino-4,6-dideoxygalactose transaminase
VFVDVDPGTLLLDPAQVEAALGPRTAAVIAVHLYGQPCDMDALGAIADRAGVPLIEDAAQAHGATWRGRRAGSLGRIGCFSFYPGKNLGGFGDAGAVTTDDPDLARTIRSLANHGRAPGSHHEHERIGANHRLDALQAAILSVKLARLDAWNAARTRVVGWYREALADLPVRLLDQAPGAVSAHHLMVVRLAERDRVQAALQAQGIATGVHYPIPCHRQKAFAGTEVPFLPVVERAAPLLLSLPLHPHLGADEVAVVADALRVALASARPAAAPELVAGA